MVKNDEKIINSMASFIHSQDIDEFLCKKVKCRRYDTNGVDNGDEYDCVDCIISYFNAPCKWKADNDVCVNGECEYCADFVSEMQCGKCYQKELGEQYDK